MQNLSKISGPSFLGPRIDIQCEIQAVPFKDVKGVPCNAQMSERMIHQYAEPDEQGLELLRMAMERLNLSARAYSRILKVHQGEIIGSTTDGSS